MTTSREQFLIVIADVFGAPIPEETRIFFRERLRRRLHELVLQEFAELEAKGFTRAQLARRIGKTPAQITRYLGGPGNWTIATVSDLLLGMGGEPALEAVAHLADRLPKKDREPVSAENQYLDLTLVSDALLANVRHLVGSVSGDLKADDEEAQTLPTSGSFAVPVHATFELSIGPNQ